jgi:hypothetical protein
VRPQRSWREHKLKLFDRYWFGEMVLKSGIKSALAGSTRKARAFA